MFGRGDNPINFVSAHDVAQFVALSVVDPAMRGRLVTVAGPDNVTFNQMARTFQTVTGKTGVVRHVPLPAMRFMSAVMLAVKPALGREIQAGVFLDTADRTADESDTRTRYPSIPITGLVDMITRDYGANAK